MQWRMVGIELCHSTCFIFIVAYYMTVPVSRTHNRSYPGYAFLYPRLIPIPGALGMGISRVWAWIQPVAPRGIPVHLPSHD